MQFAFEPYMIIGCVVILMTASSFGLPVPEELTLVTVGILVFMGMRPDLYPPPSPDMGGLNVHVAAAVCFVSVLGSDFLVFWLGRAYGDRILRSRFMSRFISEGALEKVKGWTSKRGYLACGVFRFTPGIRFPGHLTCGALGISPWKFLLVDGTAALVSVPVQVYLVAYYGEIIVDSFKDFKIAILSIIAVGICIYFIRGRFGGKSSNERIAA